MRTGLLGRKRRPESFSSKNPPQSDKDLQTDMRLRTESFPDNYTVKAELGKGAFSRVYRCEQKSTGKEFAVKMIDLRPLKLRRSFNAKRLQREVEILKDVHHGNIVKLEEVFEEPDKLLLVMEHVPGIDLFDAILARGHFKEADAKPVFHQLTSAVAYLHSKHIVHRDIKPENVKVVSPAPTVSQSATSSASEDAGTPPRSVEPTLAAATIVKLLDFGLSKTVDDFGSGAHTFVGTPCYLAPEVEIIGKSKTTTGRYGVKVDCWSLGAVLYVMLVAKFPEFDRSSDLPLIKFEGPQWLQISDEAKHLIRRLMDPNPETRLAASEALKHGWFQSCPVPPASPGTRHLDGRQLGMPVVQLSDGGDMPGSAAASTTGVMGPSSFGGLDSFDMEEDDDADWEDNAHPSRVGRGAESTRQDRYRSRSRSRSRGRNARSPSPHQSTAVPSLVAMPRGLHIQVDFDGHSAQGSAARAGVATDLDLAVDGQILKVPTPQQSGAVDTHYSASRKPKGDGTPRVTSLLGLHNRVQNLLQVAADFFTQAEVATKIRLASNKARAQIVETVKVLRKLDQLTEQIVESVQDLNIAVEEDEPRLARGFLQRQREWVMDLRQEMKTVQLSNQELVRNVMDITEIIELTWEEAKHECIAKLDALPEDTRADRILKLERKKHLMDAVAKTAAARVKPMVVQVDGSLIQKLQAASSSSTPLSEDEILSIMLPKVSVPCGADVCGADCEKAIESHECPLVRLHILLNQIDAQLESSTILWAQIEVVFDTILHKEDVVNQMVDFTKNPRLLARFQTRLKDYEYFWNSMRRMVVANLSH